MDSVIFILWNIPVLLVLTLYLKGIINALKRYYVAIECADVAAFTFATIVFTLQLRPSRIYLLLRESPVG